MAPFVIFLRTLILTSGLINRLNKRVTWKNLGRLITKVGATTTCTGRRVVDIYLFFSRPSGLARSVMMMMMVVVVLVLVDPTTFVLFNEPIFCRSFQVHRMAPKEEPFGLLVRDFSSRMPFRSPLASPAMGHWGTCPLELGHIH